MTIERDRVITITARTDAQARDFARRFVPAPDARWSKGEPVVTRRFGTQRTVRVRFTLNTVEA